jgi:hypothetical protein
MKRIGNLESNKTYNPRNVKAQIPIDVDEVDGAMERYIRAKYEQRIYLNDSRLGTRQNTGSTSSEDRPPPLPPKPTGRFGFGLRKAATSPQNPTPPLSPGLGGFIHNTSPPRVNKPSRVFGSNIHTSGDGMDSKLTTLRDMGFPDDRRNSTVLKGLNGNLDRAVEALIRLGEQNVAKSRGSTPTPSIKSSTNGISFDAPNTAPAHASSTNPFDALDAPVQGSQQQHQPQLAAIQTQQTPHVGASTQPGYTNNSYNPFLSQTTQGYGQQQAPLQQQQQSYTYQQNPWDQQQQNLEQSFQGMQVTNQQPQQPLFPNRTGGYGQTQPSPYAQTNPYNQSFTPPPMPQIPEQYSSFFAPQPQPQYQSMSNPSSPGNPFLRSSKSQMFTPTTQPSANPFGQALQQQPSQPQQAPQQQQGPNPWSQQQQAPNPWSQQQQQVQAPQASNPWQGQQQSYQNEDTHQNFPTQQQSFQNQQQQSFQSQQQLYQQQSSNPFDKNSIMSLYNQPQQAEQQQAPPATSQASTSAQVPGRSNPFASISAAPQGQPLSAAQTPGVRHVSNESADFSGLMGGRHSPDAFSGLSASFRR